MKETLDFWGPIFAGTQAPAATEALFEWLSPLDRPAFERAHKRLERVLKWRPGSPTLGPPRKKLSASAKTKRDRSRKGRVVGLLFERLLRRLFPGKGAITALSNIQTTTNEIDLLLQIEPMGMRWVPMLADAGTHAIGEAKCHADAPSSRLTDTLVGLLSKKNAKLAFLFVHCSSRTLSVEARVSIALHWKDGYQIVPVGRKQLEEVRKGASVLRVLQDQHLLAKVSATKLAV